MKVNYLIWLIGGQCIEGTAEESEVDTIILNWKEHPHVNPIQSFHDDDGETTINISKIQAIAKNQIEKNKVYGY